MVILGLSYDGLLITWTKMGLLVHPRKEIKNKISLNFENEKDIFVLGDQVKRLSNYCFNNGRFSVSLSSYKDDFRSLQLCVETTEIKLMIH